MWPKEPIWDHALSLRQLYCCQSCSPFLWGWNRDRGLWHSLDWEVRGYAGFNGPQKSHQKLKKKCPWSQGPLTTSLDFKDFPFNHIWWSLAGHVGQAVVADGLSNGCGHGDCIVAFWCHVAVKPSKALCTLLGWAFWASMWYKKENSISGYLLKKTTSKPELLTHLLPVPTLIVHVREGGVEEEGGNGLVRWGWREFKIWRGDTADIRFLIILFKRATTSHKHKKEDPSKSC